MEKLEELKKLRVANPTRVKRILGAHQGRKARLSSSDVKLTFVINIL